MATVTATSTTRFVTSADGTAIAYDVTGTGPAVVVVEGALCQRTMGTAHALIPLLSQRFTVFAYDRRGRGESGPGSSPFAVQREVEELIAVLEVAGPDAFVVGAIRGSVGAGGPASGRHGPEGCAVRSSVHPRRNARGARR
jgi:pimeloyl-ACP methyl ester carboxylesterase